MFKKYVLGMCVNSRSNLIYNPYKRYIVYSVNNKVIVEFLEECRSQIILEDSLDEISVSLCTFIYINIYKVIIYFDKLEILSRINWLCK